MTAEQIHSLNQNDIEMYNPKKLISDADAKVLIGDIPGAEMLYKEALLDWVDDAREGAGLDPEKMKNAIADLWCGYADFYYKLKKVRFV